MVFRLLYTTFVWLSTFISFCLPFKNIHFFDTVKSFLKLRNIDGTCNSKEALPASAESVSRNHNNMCFLKDFPSRFHGRKSGVLYIDKKIKEIKIDESTVLTKLFERILKEQNEGNKLILSQETAGTEDSFLVDLAVAANITMILVENRESAYYTVLNNRLLQLEEKIGG